MKLRMRARKLCGPIHIFPVASAPPQRSRLLSIIRPSV